MSTSSRFNLSILRNPTRVTPPPSNRSSNYLVSRRAFLALSGAGATVAAIPSYLSGDGFEIVQRGQAVYVLAGQQVRWVIDPAHFGSRSSLRLKREHNRSELSLFDAVFPGTDLPADLRAIFDKSSGSWLLQVSMKCGFNFEANLLSWLSGELAGSGTLNASDLTALPGVRIRQCGLASATFSPSWNFAVRGPGEVILDRLPRAFPFSRWEISLQPSVQVAGGDTGERTLFTFPRAHDDWNIPLDRRSDEGWALQHGSGVFDELVIEGVQRNNERVQTAMLSSSRNSGELFFHPGGGLLSNAAESFRIQLHRPRMAFGLENGEVNSALVADLSTEPVWAHAPEMSVLLCGSSDHPHFELFESQQAPATTAQPTVTPQILCADIPCGADANMKVMFNGKHPLHFNWATGIQGIERVLGGLDMTPWESHLGFDLTKDHELRLLRPRDQFQLSFRFENMKLSAGFGSNIRRRKKARDVGGTSPTPSSDTQIHCVPIPGRTARITVLFPPQHLTELAFFESLKKNPTPGQLPLVCIPI